MEIEEERETSDAEAPQPSDSKEQENKDSEPLVGPEEESSPKAKKSFWQEARVPIIAAVVGSLVLIITPPIRNWSLGAADAAKDVVVALIDWDEHLVDGVKERISHRPYWRSGPSFLDGSVDYLNGHIDSTDPILNEVHGLRPTVVSVDRMVEEGVKFDGVPVFLVGRVLSNTTINSDEYGDPPTQEIVLSGADRRHILILGAGGEAFNNVSAYRGEIAVVQGVLTATGRIDDPYSDEEIESGFFTVLYVPEAGLRNPLLRSQVERLE